MGILGATCDSLVEASEYFEHAIAIRTAAGDPHTTLLGNSYLCYSRVYSARGEWQKAFQLVGQAEALFSRTVGGGAPLMAQ